MLDQTCRGLFCRKLEGNRPSRKLGRRAQAVPLREVGHLGHNAVGVKTEGSTRVGPLLAEGQHLVDAIARPPVRLDRQTPGAKLGQHFLIGGLRVGWSVVRIRLRHVIHEGR